MTELFERGGSQRLRQVQPHRVLAVRLRQARQQDAHQEVLFLTRLSDLIHKSQDGVLCKRASVEVEFVEIEDGEAYQEIPRTSFSVRRSVIRIFR